MSTNGYKPGRTLEFIELPEGERGLYVDRGPTPPHLLKPRRLEFVAPEPPTGRNRNRKLWGLAGRLLRWWLIHRLH